MCVWARAAAAGGRAGAAFRAAAALRAEVIASPYKLYKITIGKTHLPKYHW